MEEKLNEIVNKLETLTQELDELKAKVTNLRYEKDITDLFGVMSKIAPRSYAHNSIIFIDNNTVKYIARDDQKSGFANFIVVENFAYEWSDYIVKNKTIIITNYTKYTIPKEIIDKLKMLPESPLKNIDPMLLKLYYFLKQEYKLIIVEDQS